MLKIASVCAALILAATAFSTSVEAGPHGVRTGGNIGRVGSVGRMGVVGPGRIGTLGGPGRFSTLGGRGIYRAGVRPGRYAYGYGRYGHRYPGYRYGYPGYGYGYNGDYWPYVGLGVAAGALALSSQYYDYGYAYDDGSYDDGYYGEPYYAPPGGYRTWNGCPYRYTVQDGVCKPYRGY